MFGQVSNKCQMYLSLRFIVLFLYSITFLFLLFLSVYYINLKNNNMGTPRSVYNAEDYPVIVGIDFGNYSTFCHLSRL